MEDQDNTSNPLDVLVASGTVLGTCLLKKGEILYENFPCSATTLVKICRVFDGLTKEYKKQGSQINQMAFGYNGGNLLAVTLDDYRLIIIHLMADEIDFLANTARAHLSDLITPPDPAQVALNRRELKEDATEQDSRAEILTADKCEFDDATNNLLPENMSVAELVQFFATQHSGD